MKITTFNPLIITRDPEAAIQVFEELGFVRRHTKLGWLLLPGFFYDFCIDKKNTINFPVHLFRKCVINPKGMHRFRDK